MVYGMTPSASSGTRSSVLNALSGAPYLAVLLGKRPVCVVPFSVGEGSYTLCRRGRPREAWRIDARLSENDSLAGQRHGDG